MKTFSPNYYKSFKCIADKCRHTCCKGWEIYLDDETVEKYERLGGKFTEKLIHADDGVCFCLTEDERCPFLNQNGLCDIISEKGEDYISEICREHPRFYNWFSHRTEVGLGLSCEEAARIILSQEEITELEEIDDDGVDDTTEEIEKNIIEARDILSAKAQDRSIDVNARIDSICKNLPSKSFTEWGEILSELDIMDNGWKELLKTVKNVELTELSTRHSIYFEKLLVYFIYRHVSSAYDTESLKKRVAFACVSARMIMALWLSSDQQTFEKLCDISRMYSAEIEYSEENTEALTEMM